MFFGWPTFCRGMRYLSCRNLSKPIAFAYAVKEELPDKSIYKEMGLGAMSPDVPPKRHDKGYPLWNFLVCAACGGEMTGYEVKRKGLHYYKCNTIGCRVNRSARLLHSQFLEMIRAVVLNERMLEPFKRQLSATSKKLVIHQKDDLAHTQACLRNIERKLDKLEEWYVLHADISKEQFQKYSQKLMQEKQDLESRLPSRKIKGQNQEKYLAFSLHICSNLALTWDSIDFHGKRKLQNLIFPQGVEYDKHKDRLSPREAPGLNSLSPLFTNRNTCHDTGDRMPSGGAV